LWDLGAIVPAMSRFVALLTLLVVVGCATTEPRDSTSQKGWSIARPSQLAHVMPDSIYQLLRALPADSLTAEQRAQLAEEKHVRSRLGHQLNPLVILAFGAVVLAAFFAAA
jgi:hypothetical protein